MNRIYVSMLKTIIIKLLQKKIFKIHICKIESDTNWGIFFFAGKLGVKCEKILHIDYPFIFKV